MGQGERRVGLELFWRFRICGNKRLTSPKSRGFSCQAKTIVSFLELLLRNSRRLHLPCTGMFPREM